MTDLSTTTAVVLAGGQGTRIRSALPVGVPKVLAEVNGRPWLAHVLDRLEDAGIRHVVVCTRDPGEAPGKVDRFLLGTYKQRWAFDVKISREFEPLGTGGALRKALGHIHSSTALVLNGDSICPVDLTAFISRHKSHPRRAATLLLTEVPDVSRFGSVTVGDNDWITGFAEKGGSGPGLVSAGIYAIEREVIALMPGNVPLSLERDVFPEWARTRIIAGDASGGTLTDIGTPEALAAARLAAHELHACKEIATPHKMRPLP